MMYEAFDIWKRDSYKQLIRYRCFRNLETNRYAVQSSDWYSLPIDSKRVTFPERQFGSKENAWQAIQEAGSQQLTGGGVADGAPATINVGGQSVTVTGFNSPTGFVVGNVWIP
jgi:hypothetical protein